MKIVPRRVSLATAVGVALVFIGAAAAFAWFFLRGKVMHEVSIGGGDIEMRSGGVTYTGTPAL